MRFWVSWYQETVDYRPLSFPPNEKILGWWRSGYGADDAATLCACVNADNRNDAKQAILHDWPEAEKWRFCDPVSDDWQPGDRFPLSDWMVERFSGQQSSQSGGG